MNFAIQHHTMLPGLLLLAVLGGAIITDLRSRRIPNALIGPALSVALIYSVVTGGVPSLIGSIGGLAVGLALFLPMYSFGAMGAGDVKLLGVTGAFLGPQGAIVAGLAAFVAGACFAMLWIIWHAARQTVLLSGVQHNDVQEEPGAVPAEGIVKKRGGIPYAPAIAAGAVFAIWQQGLFTPLGMG